MYDSVNKAPVLLTIVKNTFFAIAFDASSRNFESYLSLKIYKAGYPTMLTKMGGFYHPEKLSSTISNKIF